MTEEVSEPQEQGSVSEQVQGEVQYGQAQDTNHADSEAKQEEQLVPVSVVQRERRKRQQAQQELELLRSKQAPQEENYERFESATKGDLAKSEFNVLRKAEENVWARQHPDRVEYVNQEIEEFLTMRPNLAAAIQDAPNRLHEAWELMTKLSPKQKVAVKQQPQRQDAPHAPGTVPRAAALNDAVDLMNMNDSDFRKWRSSKRRAR